MLGLFARLFAFRRRRRLTAVLGLAVLAFNLWGSAVLPVGAAMAAGATITVCTQTGMVDIPVSDSDASHSSGHSGSLCAFCLPMMHGGADLAADAPPLVQPLAFSFAVRQGGLDHLIPASVRLTALNPPRAPPFSRA
jgi:hypothetical protein